MQCARKDGHFAKGFAIFQAVPAGTEAAHGQAGQKGILPPVGKREYFPRHIHQFPPDVFAKVPQAAVLHENIHVKGVFTGGHDHRQPAFL